jgi:hypothetical protein
MLQNTGKREARRQYLILARVRLKLRRPRICLIGFVAAACVSFFSQTLGSAPIKISLSSPFSVTSIFLDISSDSAELYSKTPCLKLGQFCPAVEAQLKVKMGLSQMQKAGGTGIIKKIVVCSISLF